MYLAYDPTMNREVALKVPHPGRIEDEKGKSRVLREAQAAGRLRHPNIVQTYEAEQSRRLVLHCHDIH